MAPHAGNRDSDRPVVLLVDDEPSVLAGLARSLRHEPYRIVTAGSAEEALRIMDKLGVAVVVSDENMPVVRGAELLARIRTLHPETVRIMLTGSADLAVAVRAVNEGGVFRFHTKPLAATDLAVSIRGALDSGHNVVARASDDRACSPTEAAELALVDARIVLQPIVRASDLSVFAYETLVRPGAAAAETAAELIEAVVAAGQTRHLDRAVRASLATVLPAMPPGVLAFVNLFPDSIVDEALTAIDDALRPWRHRIVLEITERSRLDEVPGHQSAMRALRELGFRLAIDDIGSGYSGLSSLLTMAPEFTKIDMALVRCIHQSPSQRAVVNAIVDLCQATGSVCVAEGVEVAEEAKALTALGCELLQGYYFGRPLPPDEALTGWIAR